MIRIKLSHPFGGFPLDRQTPKRSAAWGNCRFFINEPIKECDFWVVYEGLPATEQTRCARERTLLVTAEPPDIKTYNPAYLNQFAAVVTCHEGMAHPGKALSQQGLPWHAGLRIENHAVQTVTQDYDSLEAMPEKMRGLSVIVSNKRDTEGQSKRLDFVLRLKEILGERMELFGRGINDVADKWDALAPYSYHLAIENSSVPHYWTEKLADPLLAGAHTFYYGCPNVGEYFPEGALTSIDLDDPEQAAKIILEKMDANARETHREALTEARSLVMNRYNLFAMLAAYCETKTPHDVPSVEKISLCPEKKESQSILRRLGNFLQKFSGK